MVRNAPLTRVRDPGLVLDGTTETAPAHPVRRPSPAPAREGLPFGGPTRTLRRFNEGMPKPNQSSFLCLTRSAPDRDRRRLRPCLTERLMEARGRPAGGRLRLRAGWCEGS